MLTKLELDALTTPGRYLAGGVPGLYVQVSLGVDGQPRRSFVYQIQNRRSRTRSWSRFLSSDQPQRGPRPGTRGRNFTVQRHRPARGQSNRKGRGGGRPRYIWTSGRPTLEASHPTARRHQVPGAHRQTLAERVQQPLRKDRQLDVRDLRHAHIAGVLATVANGRGKTKRSAAGGPTVASMLRSRIERVIDFAAAHGYRDPDQVNPARVELLRDVLGRVPPAVHFRAAPLAEVPAIYQRLAQEQDSVSNAIRFLMLTACRLARCLMGDGRISRKRGRTARHSRYRPIGQRLALRMSSR